MYMNRSLLTSQNGIAGAFGLFLCLQYVITSPAPTAVAFYGLLLPCTLWFGWQHRALARAAFCERAMQWMLLFFAYCILHAVYFADVFEGASKTVRNTLQTGVFVYATALCFAAMNEARRIWVFRAVALAAGLGGAISIAVYLGDPDAEERLRPIGRADAQVLAAFAHSLAAMMGCYALFCARWRPALQALLAAAIGISYATVLLTQSRMAMLALSLSLVIGLLAFCRHPIRWAILALLVAGALIALQSTAAQGYIDTQLARGDSFRLGLWTETLRHISQSPWQGHGMMGRIEYTMFEGYSTHSPHSLFLTTALALGVPGMVVLLMALWHLALERLCRLRLIAPETLLNWLLLGLAMASALIDHSRVVKGPSPLWTLFWLPVAIAIGELVRHPKPRVTAQEPTPAPDPQTA